jgi:hypothetical protein
MKHGLLVGEDSQSWWGSPRDKTTYDFAKKTLVLYIMVIFSSWYIRNRGLRKLLLASEMTLEIRKIVIDVVEGALGTAVTSDFIKMSAINKSLRRKTVEDGEENRSSLRKSNEFSSYRPSILRRFLGWFRQTNSASHAESSSGIEIRNNTDPSRSSNARVARSFVQYSGTSTIVAQYGGAGNEDV